MIEIYRNYPMTDGSMVFFAASYMNGALYELCGTPGVNKFQLGMPGKLIYGLIWVNPCESTYD